MTALLLIQRSVRRASWFETCEPRHFSILHDTVRSRRRRMLHPTATPQPLLDFGRFQPYIATMTKLLDEAVEAVRRLPSDDQDDIARAIIQLAGSGLAAPVVLSPEEREAIARSKVAASRSEFATDEQVRAVWAKHGL